MMGRMSDPRHDERRRMEALSRDDLRKWQLQRLNEMLLAIIPLNRFYTEKFHDARLPLNSWEEFQELPWTTKEELVPTPDQAPHAKNHTFGLDHYVRYHQTSGTKGRPLVVLDTEEDWQWWIVTWQYVLDAAEIKTEDRVFMAFGFGPFIGFWSAFDAVTARGCLTIPGGGMSTTARLKTIQNASATVVFCTPTYALHLAETAQEQGVDLAQGSVRVLILAGEPGGSLPSVRQRLETAWGAKLIDHAGASEIGPWGFADREDRGLHVNEAEFIAEFWSHERDAPAEAGELSELVLTNLGRKGTPLIRYRTGDLVRPIWPESGPCRFVLLEGGVLGRADDMLIIRGVNIFPSSIESIVRQFHEIQEYRLTATKKGELDDLSIEIEDPQENPERVAEELQLQLSLRVEVTSVPLGSLPRSEGKSRRFVDLREK